MKKLLLLMILGLVCVSLVSAGHLINSSSLPSFNDSLFGYWLLDDASGNLTDVSGLDNQLSPIGTPVYQVAGKVNYGVDFIGDDDRFYKDITDYSGNFTISGWFDINQNYRSMAISTVKGSNGFIFGTASASAWLFGEDGASFATTSAQEHVWTHYTGVFNGTNSALYKNGVLVDVVASSSITNTDLYLGIYGDRGVYPYDGTMDEIIFHQRDLSATEVSCIFNLTNQSGNCSLSVNAEDTTPPTVTQQIPINNTIYTDTNNITFACYVEDETDLSNVSLWWNYTSWDINTTNTSGINPSNYTFSFTNLNNGTYEWNCQGVDSAGNEGWGSNQSFTIAYTPVTPPIVKGVFRLLLKFVDKTSDKLLGYFDNGGNLNITGTLIVQNVTGCDEGDALKWHSTGEIYCD